MDWNQIGAKWDLLKGSVKQEWGDLTDDDLDYIAGTRDKLVGRLREKYGIAKEEAERQAERWFITQKNPAAVLPPGAHPAGPAVVPGGIGFRPNWSIPPIIET